ncbi:bifunctional chorismate mutase/prephenate dehydratase [Ruminococcus sp.]|uniref:bifunctional chorismate mutase/prephenate dehydratase n=1 Tax=Ruminococcus sp. TaxID=41978 RepID=UPI002E80F9B7|nr:prephenate dehydratase domain-containing protein [Ruminococcus sp.]MEE3492450.1 prephenate dehydratase domain-containing protein [Ruminococcus sp.]
MDKLQEARTQINEIDSEMAALFERRMQAARVIAEYKKERGLQIYDAKREQAVIEKNAANIKDPDIRSYYVRFLQDEMAVSKRYQEHIISGVKVAYSGIEGAYANIAAKQIFPYGKLISYRDFKAAYEAVERGECDCCVLPIENSYAGEVGQVMDLMFQGSLYVNGLYTLRITHHLLGVPGASGKDIKTVVSHPQALAQCAEYIRKHGYQTIEYANTAKAAKAVKDGCDKSVAAIASAETARLYGLEQLDHDINESALNSTRFAVFSRVENKKVNTTGDSRFMLMFTVKNEAGALAQALNVLSSYGFNMRALRSRPMKDLAWEYYFYIEAEGDETGQNGSDMLRHLGLHCDMLKVVGHFSDEVILQED